MYQIQDLVDHRNLELYEKLNSQIKIELSDKPSDDGYWSAELTDDKSGLIKWSSTESPISSFTHELLHLQFDIAGMGKPGFRVSTCRDNFAELQDWVNIFVNYSYNQLIHRKMYPHFVAMGFLPSQFTADCDYMALDQVKGDLVNLRQLKKISNLTIKDWGMPFLSLVDLSGDKKEANKILNELKKLMGPGQAVKMTKYLRDFDEDASPEMPRYMARLLAFVPNSVIEFGYCEDSLVSWSNN
jgi:hypothetical protein